MNILFMGTFFNWIGREYRAIFICTSEPAKQDCSPEEKTKSLCEATVFNTVITRACSLVVACGNPFRILKMEEKMGNSKHCWMEFLHRCMENRSLLLSKDLSKQRDLYKDALHKLEEIMFERASRNLMALPELRPDTGDSIMQSYNDEFKKKNAKLALGRVGNDSGWKLWDIHSSRSDEILVPDTAESQVQVGSSRSVRCRLWQRSHGDCVAIPSDRHQQKFTVKADKRRCAFEGACVEVEEIWKNPESGERFGRVCSIVEQGSIQPVLCQVDRNNVLAFYPVDGKSPKFLNLPHLSKQLLEEMSVKDLGKHLNKPKKYISCFDPKFLTKGYVPKISDSVPLEVAHNLLFVVQPLYWSPKYRHPIGAVIGAFPKGTSMGHAMKILSIEYQVPDGHADIPVVEPVETPLKADSKHVIGIRGLNGYCQIGLSIEHKHDKSSVVSIYITDVTDHIFVKNVYRLDEHVKQRASFLGECKDMNVYRSILPEKVLELASFNSTHPVKCFCLQLPVPALSSETQVNIHGAELQSGKFIVSKCIISFHELEYILQNTSQGKPLSKESLEQLKEHNKDSSISAVDKIFLLFKVAERLHFQRKGHSGYSNMEPHSYLYPDAWKLVNEMLILVNSTAAKRIARTFPKRTLLKVQAPLSEHSEREIVESFSGLLQFTSQYGYLPIDKESDPDVTQIPFPRAICSNLLKVLASSQLNFMLAKQLLSLPMYHAHLLVLDAVISDHVPKEEYAVKKIVNKSKKEVDTIISSLDQPAKYPDLVHYSQNAVCSPITSPFDSVLDIYAQGLLKLSIAGDRSVQDLSHQEFVEIVRQCNMSTLNANNYSTALASLNLAISAQHSSVCVDAVIKGLSDGNIQFSYHHPSLNMPSLSEVKVSLLTKSSKVNVARFSMKITSARYLLRVLTNPCYETEEKGDKKLLVFNSSGTSGNLKQHHYFIAYVPQYASVSLEEWKFVKKFMVHSDKESAMKLESFLSDFLESEFHKSYQFQPLSKNRAALEAAEDQKHPWSKKKAKSREPWDMKEAPFVIMNTPFEFAQLQTFKMWLRADTNEYVATPKPQLLELSPDVRVCLQHIDEPEFCFTSGIVAESSKVRYSSMRQYRRTWEEIILSEAAVSSIKGNPSQIFLFSDFLLYFSGFEVPQDCIGEEFYEPSGEITAILTKEFLQSRQDIFPFDQGYFVCARYEINLEEEPRFIQNYSGCLHPAASDKCARIVLHMVVDDIVRMDDDVEVETDVVMSEEPIPVYCNAKVGYLLT